MSQLKPLGMSALRVSSLCFGGNVFGWTVDEPTTYKLLDAWVDHGFNFIDTADVYSRWAPGNQGGESETMIGKWLKRSGKRDQVVIATKVGGDMGQGRVCLAADYIRRSVDDSLRRLQTDCIDVYFAHRDDPQTPLEETLSAFDDLVRAGKVRVLGASNYDASRLSQALQVSQRNSWPRYEVVQPLYNLYDRAPFEAELKPLCQREGLGVMNYYALAAGFLTGKYRTQADAAKSTRGPGVVNKYMTTRGLRILSALDIVAERLGAQPGQVAIAWLLAQEVLTSAIASASTPEQLDGLAEATRLVLSAEDLAVLDAASGA